ncbi:MAG TPA: V-type ATP synthase subunit A [Cyclobacteriaceae bacterium]|nr:V-type ATP synthase subunit A [Cyclobacteriaceae bacterium]HRJ83999.1 V-type ATP synthase subunit A [Cyclobacteriaceae bacterium]
MTTTATIKKGTVTGIISNLVMAVSDAPVAQNEICYMHVGEDQLLGEIIKVIGHDIYIQCFESTRGMKVGSTIRFTNEMLEVTLGPGMLSKIYDGLQNDLKKFDSLLIKRGKRSEALDSESRWHFIPLTQPGKTVQAGDWLGEVKENAIPHRIMVPFKLTGRFKLKNLVEEGDYGINDVIAVLESEEGERVDVKLWQKWPVKKPLKGYVEKVRPFAMLETGVRIIDTLIPIAEGGTGFIPGPFGTGKTVLQHAISKQANADVIIFAACGERANEIVDVFTEFPELDDPHTGRKLMERTIIIANTSNMPVAAREASVYTAMTIAEYFRNMGLKVLILADSTSRWAQALREMSNRLEELPGPDAFPMDLTAVIANFYARAGYVFLPNGATGSITFLGTVSPSGGNLKEPVTEATKKSARCFYALSQKRADQKRYPAVDPTESYSKYLEYPEMQNYLHENISSRWIDMVIRAKDILLRGREVHDQINILGDDGVPLDYHVQFWKAEIIDFVILQQDAFDTIDAMTPMARQKYMLQLVLQICQMEFDFKDFEEVSAFFKRIINKLKQLNYTTFESEPFKKIMEEYTVIVNEKRIA